MKLGGFYFAERMDERRPLGARPAPGPRQHGGPPDLLRHAWLAERTFSLLSDRIVGAHLKDLRWDHAHVVLKWDEVFVGDDLVDYAAYLGGLARLDPDLACYCEHLATEEDYAENFERVHAAAAGSSLRFLPRSPRKGAER